MRVLVVCHRVPFPPKRGGKIRPFNIIRHLTASGHRVTVASIARSAAELADADGLRDHCEKRLIEVVSEKAGWAQAVANLPTSAPSSFGYFRSRALRQQLLRESAETAFDMVLVHCSSAAPYVSGIPASCRLLDFGDMDSQKWREYSHHRRFPLSLGYWLEAVKLEQAERQLAGSFDACTCTTRAELATLRTLGYGGSASWFPNGVDADYFRPADQPYDPDLIAFVGRMDYFPNQQAVLRFCDDVLPRIQIARPGVRFQIVGADPPPQIVRLAGRAGVEVTGSVPDVRPYVSRAALTVAPLEIARGTQNKILESLAMGVPVVCSKAAAGGVDARPEEDFLVCGTSEQYAVTILRVLESPSRRNALALAGRTRVLSHHSWESSMRRFDRIVSQTMEGGAIVES